MDSITERALFGLCGSLWRDSYGEGRGDTGLFQAIAKVEGRIVADGERGFDPTEVLRMALITKWIDSGAPKLVTDAKYAAALMCTKVSDDLRQDIILPWKAFRVDLPEGILGFGTYNYSHILVAQFDRWPNEDGTSVSRAALMVEGGTTHGTKGRPSLAACTQMGPDLSTILLDKEPLDQHIHPDGGQEWVAEKVRVNRLATRLVVGLLHTMQFSNNFRGAAKTLNDNRSMLRDGPPKHRAIFVGRPLQLDARPAVREYCELGKGAPPSVQTLVRGHYKRQVIGIGRGGRRVIWVEPYWRGPEDAPILARPYHVGPKESA